MTLKKLGIAILLTLAIGAVSAGSAFAGTPVTKPSSVVVGEKVLSSETVTCEKTAGSPNFVFKSAIAGAEIELQATGLECPEGVIQTKVVEGVNMAVSSGKTKLTGVTVKKPLGCSTPSTFTTVAMVGRTLMDKTVTTKGFGLFTPASGTTFTTITIEECAIEGKYVIKGFGYGEGVKGTGTQEVAPVGVSNATTNAMSSLFLATSPLSVTGEVTAKLSGENAGKAFGGKEE